MKCRNTVAIVCAALIGVCSSSVGLAQTRRTVDNVVVVDQKGVMRWKETGKEVQGFGVNYTAPFAHAFRSAKKLGVNLKKEIDNDVYHFSRLGFDAYRVHVWDTEISDTLGNLLSNEHLALFDYMLLKMKERKMKFILTPIAFWGNGYPDPDEPTPGFAHKYGKDACLINENAIKAQEKYLFQFLQHINPETGIAYKDDPDIVAFEISNEPHHQEAPEKVTQYINRMVAAMRKTGCKKPIFYNISHSIHLVDAYFNAGIQGGTFQWYPTGLGAQEELGGNLLPNVDRYTIPFADNPKFKNSAKIVYEFDAADVGRSYIYPAMARSFREAGIQWATHFAYDPTYLAHANTEYNTHYMNLLYTPQKALSLKLAGEVFHTVPMYTNFGRYPANQRFRSFRVNYENDLAEMVTERKFIYTNHTSTIPPSIQKLQEIAGCGNSTVVQYEGTGAYFLDQISPGVWRLEVLPDAIWIDNPFGKNQVEKKIAVINWRTWPMKISLPDLGPDFSLVKLNETLSTSIQVNSGQFDISPGTYLLTKKTIRAKINPDSKWNNIILKEFVAPPGNLEQTIVIHETPAQVTEGKPVNVQITVASKDLPDAVDLMITQGYKSSSISFQKISGYRYEAIIPAELVREGYLEYMVRVKERDKTQSFPSGDVFRTNVIKAGSPLYLFSAASDHQQLMRRWTPQSSVVPMSQPGVAEVRVNVEKLFTPDPENPNGKKIADYSMRYFFREKIAGRSTELVGKNSIILTARSMTGDGYIQLALVTKHGTAYGATVRLTSQSKDHIIPVADLKPVDLVTLPRPYPTFLDYWFKATPPTPFALEDAETIQLSIGPGIPAADLGGQQHLAIESIRLE